MDIPIDATVECSDGLAGRSTLVIINPTTRKVTNVVMRERQDPHTERLVPIRYVVDADEDLIRLSCPRHKLSEMREFIQAEFVLAEVPDFEDYVCSIHAARLCHTQVDRDEIPNNPPG